MFSSLIVLASGATFPAHQMTVLFFSLAVLLLTARVFGEIARRCNQPAVLGELLAGIVLGPTLLGRIRPEWSQWLFPQTDLLQATVYAGLTTLAAALFMFVAGMEVDLSRVWKQGRVAFMVSTAGTVIPFVLGFSGGWLFPSVMGMDAGANRLNFALFLAAAMSISALPVIAKTLMDLNLFRTDVGVVIIASAIINDLTGWIVFAVVLGMMTQGSGSTTPGIGYTILLTLGYSVGMLTLGRWLIDESLPWVQAHLSWPGGVIGATLGLALLGAGFTEAIGIHAIFGAFIVGVAVGDASHLRPQTRSTLHDFISFFFAPLFFASIGLRIDVAAHFNLWLVLVIFVIGCAGKMLGCGLAARRAGMTKRESWAMAFGMNARGAMEIVLGMLALEAGVIREPLFVALLFMAIATSMMSGPGMQWALERTRVKRLTDYLASGVFVPRLQSSEPGQVIRELSAALAPTVEIDAEKIIRAVSDRESIMATGLGNGVAIPHARMDGIKSAAIAFGLSKDGVNFESPDNTPARLVFLILTPTSDEGEQLQILAAIGRAFHESNAYQRFSAAESHTQFLAVLKTLPAAEDE